MAKTNILGKVEQMSGRAYKTGRQIIRDDKDQITEINQRQEIMEDHGHQSPERIWYLERERERER